MKHLNKLVLYLDYMYSVNGCIVVCVKKCFYLIYFGYYRNVSWPVNTLVIKHHKSILWTSIVRNNTLVQQSAW